MADPTILSKIILTQAVAEEGLFPVSFFLLFSLINFCLIFQVQIRGQPSWETKVLTDFDMQIELKIKWNFPSILLFVYFFVYFICVRFT